MNKCARLINCIILAPLAVPATWPAGFRQTLNVEITFFPDHAPPLMYYRYTCSAAAECSNRGISKQEASLIWLRVALRVPCP